MVNDKVPIYEETLEDVGRVNEDPALPFNAFGTLALARQEFDANSGSSQIFFLLKVCLMCEGHLPCGFYMCQNLGIPFYANAGSVHIFLPLRSGDDQTCLISAFWLVEASASCKLHLIQTIPLIWHISQNAMWFNQVSWGGCGCSTAK